MGLFLTESYSLDVDPRSLRELRTQVDGDSASSDGSVRCLDVMLIPTDGVVFMVFEGPTAEDVRSSMRAAGLAPDRVVGMVRADEPTRRADGQLPEANALAASALALAEDERQYLREPGFRRYLGDLIEGLIATGRWAEARDVLARLEQMAVRLDRPSARASAARGRAPLEVEAGDVEAAIASCKRLATQHARGRRTIRAGSNPSR